MKKMSLFCTAIAIVFVLAACGQKGPLYLPQPAKPSPDAPKTAPGTTPVPAPKQTTTSN